MNRFDEKVVIVTGSSYGIGLAAAQSFAREGAHVVICARGADKLEAAAKQIRDDGGSVTAVTLDLTDLESFQKVDLDTFKKDTEWVLPIWIMM